MTATHTWILTQSYSMCLLAVSISVVAYTTPTTVCTVARRATLYAVVGVGMDHVQTRSAVVLRVCATQHRTRRRESRALEVSVT